MRTLSLEQRGFIRIHCWCLSHNIEAHSVYKDKNKAWLKEQAPPQYLTQHAFVDGHLILHILVKQLHLRVPVLPTLTHTPQTKKVIVAISLCSLKPSMEHQPGTSHGWNMVL